MPRRPDVRHVTLRRVFALLHLLGDGQAHELGTLADRLQVSTRTIRRDIKALVTCGIPIDSRLVPAWNGAQVAAYQIPDRQEAAAAFWSQSAVLS